MPKPTSERTPTSDLHDAIRQRLHQLAAPRSKDLDVLLRYYVGTKKAYDQAGRLLLRALE